MVASPPKGPVLVVQSFGSADLVARGLTANQHQIEYENVVLDLQKKYELRNRTVVLKPPPKNQN